MSNSRTKSDTTRKQSTRVTDIAECATRNGTQMVWANRPQERNGWTVIGTEWQRAKA